jgi:Leucine-rich repeat (LRR) protein
MMYRSVSRRGRMNDWQIGRVASTFKDIDDLCLANSSLDTPGLEEIASKLSITLTSLDVSSCFKLSSLASLSSLPCMTSLTSLNLDRCRAIDTDSITSVIMARPPLRTLLLSGTRVRDPAPAKLLTTLSGTLTTLDISNCVISTGLSQLVKSLGEVKDGPILRTLNISGTQFNNSELDTFSMLGASLTDLNISFLPKVTDAGLTGLEALTSLTSLDLSRNAQVTDATIALLQPLQHLRTLNASRIDITHLCGDVIGQLQALTSLDLGYNPLFNDNGGALLAPLTQLTSLSLPYTAITDTFVKDHIHRFSLLSSLKLNGCTGVGDMSMGALRLSSMYHLTSLDIGSSRLTNSCLRTLRRRAVRRWPKLARVGIWVSGVRDAGIQMLLPRSDFALDGAMKVSLLHLLTYLYLASLYRCSIWGLS